MKKFIGKILLFFIPVAIILGGFEYLLYQIPNAYNTKRDLIEHHLDSVEVLVLGSSQSYYGIDPSCFRMPGLNMANNSQSLYYDEQITLKYLPQLKKLKCVVMAVSYFSLWNQLADMKEDWRDSFYYYYWDIRYPDLGWDNAKNYSLIMLYGPQTALEYAGKRFNPELTADISPNGWAIVDTMTKNPYISDELGKKRMAYHQSTLKPERFEENIKMLDAFVAACKARNVQVCFITPPVFKTYYANADTAVVNKNSKAIKALCDKYGATYHDYFTDGRFTLKDFNDNDHLNFMGAKKFSHILDQDLLSAWVPDSLIKQ